MKVLLLSWNYPPMLGGIESVVENLHKGLKRHGHEAVLVTSYAAGVPSEEGMFRAPRKGLKPFLGYSLFKGGALCFSFRPDIIVCGSIVTTPPAYILSRIFRRPFLVLVYGSDISHEGWSYQRAIRWLLSRATQLVAHSAQIKVLLEQAGMDGEKIEVIHPGVNTEHFAEEPESGADGLIREIKGRRVLLSVGRLIRRKGLLEFVEYVMPGLTKDYPDIVMLIVGDDATASLAHPERMKERIAAKVHQLGLEEQVKLLGTVSKAELIRLYFRAEVFVLPCLDLPGDIEGFGIVLLEAALAGTPSVATRVGGIPEAVEDGETGLLVQPGDFDGLRRAIARLLDDEKLRREMAEAGADRARRLFDWDVIIAKYEQAFDRCLRTVHS